VRINSQLNVMPSSLSISVISETVRQAVAGLKREQLRAAPATVLPLLLLPGLIALSS
jgi:hypothetical protein